MTNDNSGRPVRGQPLSIPESESVTPPQPHLPAPPAAYALPPSVVRRLEASKDGCSIAGNFVSVSPARRKAIQHALTWEHKLGASRAEMTALAKTWMSSDALQVAQQADGLTADVQWQIASLANEYVSTAVWLVDGGPCPFSSSVEPTPANDPVLSSEQSREYLEGIKGCLDLARLPGDDGVRDAATLRVICDLSLDLKWPTITPALPVRSIALLSSSAEGTVEKSIARLVKAGFLELRVRGGEATGNRYLIRWPLAGGEQPSSGVHDCYIVNCLLPGLEHYVSVRDPFRLSHDAFRRKGLGLRAFALLHHLISHNPQTYEDWWTGAGVSRSQFKRLRKDLTIPVELALKVDGRWTLPPDIITRLDKAAVHCDTAGMGEERLETAAIQRAWNHERLLRQADGGADYQIVRPDTGPAYAVYVPRTGEARGDVVSLRDALRFATAGETPPWEGDSTKAPAA